MNNTFCWDDGEYPGYMGASRCQFDEMLISGSKEMSQEARTPFEGGLDGVSKTPLITSCPRLRDIKVVSLHHKPGSTLGWLKGAASISAATGHWGLIASLLLLSVFIHTWRSTERIHTPDVENAPMCTFSAFLRLPGLQSIYWNDFR